MTVSKATGVIVTTDSLVLNSFEMRVLGPRSRSQELFIEKHCHGSSTFINRLILILYHTNG